jgi:glutamine cyclotransferase
MSRADVVSKPTLSEEGGSMAMRQTARHVEDSLEHPAHEAREQAEAGSGWYAWLARLGLTAKGVSSGPAGPAPAAAHHIAGFLAAAPSFRGACTSPDHPFEVCLGPRPPVQSHDPRKWRSPSGTYTSDDAGGPAYAVIAGRHIARLLVAAAALAPVALGGVPAGAPVYGYTVVRVRPHDPTSYTEGLAYRDGYLIESSGQRSSLRRVALASGRVVRRVSVAALYFAEGATVLRGRVYQLTWMQRTAFVYDVHTFRRLRKFRYEGEGWGLANDGVSLIMSDGSDTLTFRNPSTFAVRRRLTVTDAGQAIRGLNELDVVRGRICANVHSTDRVACIDANSGQVAYWIDLTGLLPPELRSDEGAVLNGIAYDAKRNRLFVTGKLWPRLYEIRRAAPRSA